MKMNSDECQSKNRLILKNRKQLADCKFTLGCYADKINGKDIFNGEESEPIFVPSGSVMEPDEKFQQSLLDCKKRDGESKLYMCENIDHSVLAQLRKCDSARNLFITICDIFKPSGSDNLFRLSTDFHHVK